MPAGDDLLEDQGRELLGEFCEKPRHAPAVRTEVRRVSHEEAQGHQHRPDLARNGGLSADGNGNIHATATAYPREICSQGSP